jgi:hypothetical protein
VYKLWSSSLCSLPHPLATFYLLGRNVLLSTLFSDTLNLFSSLWVRDKISYPHKTAGNVIMYILILTVLIMNAVLLWGVSRKPVSGFLNYAK